MATKRKKPTVEKAPRVSARDALAIVVKVKENPRKSEIARRLFDLYATHKTVGAYREAAKKITAGYSSYFTEDIQHGAIELRERQGCRSQAGQAQGREEGEGQARTHASDGADGWLSEETSTRSPPRSKHLALMTV